MLGGLVLKKISLCQTHPLKTSPLPEQITCHHDRDHNFGRDREALYHPVTAEMAKHDELVEDIHPVIKVDMAMFASPEDESLSRRGAESLLRKRIPGAFSVDVSYLDKVSKPREGDNGVGNGGCGGGRV